MRESEGGREGGREEERKGSLICVLWSLGNRDDHVTFMPEVSRGEESG